MASTLIIAKRELTSLFYSPIAYVLLIASALGCTVFFLNGYGSSMPATMQGTYNGVVVWMLFLFVPAISMRLLSEEFRNGTIEPLLTAPLSDAQVVVGKWLGAMGFLIVLFLPLWVLVGVLTATASPDYGPILTGYLGLLLICGFYMSIGTFASTFTQNQVIAFIITSLSILILTLAMYLLVQASWLNSSFRQAVDYMNVFNQFEDFNKGLIDVKKIVYFLSGIALFLFLAVRVLESRRWR